MPHPLTPPPSLLSSYFSSSSLNKKRIPLLLVLFAISSCPILCIPIFFQDPLPLCPSTSPSSSAPPPSFFISSSLSFPPPSSFLPSPSSSIPPPLSNPAVPNNSVLLDSSSRLIPSSNSHECKLDCSALLFDLENGPRSISTDFSLVCEKKSLKTLAITINFIGIFVGCVCSSFILIESRKRQAFLGVVGVILGLSLILMTITKNFEFIVGLIGIASFCFMYINTYSYLFISENFEGGLASFVTLMYSSWWALFGILYAIYAQFTNASWKPLCLICGLLGLLVGILLLLTQMDEKENKDHKKKNEKEERMKTQGWKDEEERTENCFNDEEEERREEGWRQKGERKKEECKKEKLGIRPQLMAMEKSKMVEEGNSRLNDDEGAKKEKLVESLKEVWMKPQIRTNFLVYAWFWSFFTICYCCILIELESVGGNLYINMVLCSMIELLACVLAGWLGREKKNCGWEEGRRKDGSEEGSIGIIRKILNFLSLFFGVFVFAPITLGSGSGSLFFIFCLLAAKLNNDTLNLITYLNLKKAFTARYVGVWMLVSRFMSRFLGLFIPYLNLGFRTLGIHPFVFYGLIWGLCRLSFSRVREISNLKDEKEIPLIALKNKDQS